MRLEELATEDHRVKMKEIFKQNGFKQIGDGLEAIVYAKDSASVTKVIFPAATYSTQEHWDQALRTFMLFMQYCEQNPSPHLPNVEYYGTITVDGEKLHQAIMERLKPLRKDSVTELMIWYMAEKVTQGTPWTGVYSEMCEPMMWEDIPDTDIYALAKKVQKMPYNKLLGFVETYHVMEELYAFGQQNNLGWDCHTENVMQRADGTLVITDPWSH
jgi:hypothetical protein